MPDLKLAPRRIALSIAVASLMVLPLWHRFGGAGKSMSSEPAPDRVVAALDEAVTAFRPSTGARQFSISMGACIPENGVLRTRAVSREVREAQSAGFGDRTPLLNEVIRMAPKYFPPHARVISVRHESVRSSYFQINLNRAFANSRFWNGRRRGDSVLAFHALARNTAFMNDGKGIPLPVQFVVEGKEVARIGAFATRQPLSPDKIMRAS